jgi:hypothetical protein
VFTTSAPAVLGSKFSIAELANGDLIATLVTDDNFIPLALHG